MDWLYTCSGLLVGTLVGATGVGGGSLMTPILVMLFGVPANTAVGTDLIFASITKGVGTALHGFNRSVNWRIVAALCVFVPQGAVVWHVGLVMGACNLVGGYLGARTAVARGARFVRAFFVIVVAAFVVRIGGEVLGLW